MPYKVVTKDRKSCMVIAEPYIRDYIKDEIIEAPSDTLGIMIFRLKKDAKEFMRECSSWMMLKVKGLGEGTIPIRVAGNSSREGLDRFYEHLSEIHYGYSPVLTAPPLGTICYQSIKVLE